MTITRRAAALFMMAAGLTPALAQVTPAPQRPVILAPHVAVYDLKLDTQRPSRSVDDATGRIAYDFGGDACDGYTLNFRQVTVLRSSETGDRQIDVRTSQFEDGEGKLFRFKTQSLVGGRVEDRVDGSAERRGDGYRVTMVQPRRERNDIPGDLVFPSEHLKRIIQAAQRGETTFSIKSFDGSDDGKTVYDTLAVIGRRIEPGTSMGLEEAARKPELDALPRWPVRISYFKSGQGEVTPSYAISFDLYENGITRQLLLDYRDFRLTGQLVRLDIKAPTACRK